MAFIPQEENNNHSDNDYGEKWNLLPVLHIDKILFAASKAVSQVLAKQKMFHLKPTLPARFEFMW
jgi:hypothetical protein